MRTWRCCGCWPTAATSCPAAGAQTLNRLHRLLAELVPGGAPRHLSALQAKALLARCRPRDLAGRTRRALAAELIGELEALDGKLKALKRRLAEAVTAAGSGLMDIYGIGPAGAARILADVGDVARFADRNRFASWTGTAPIDASSGEQIRHRLSRAGNRRLNHVLYIAAVCQIRHDTPGRGLLPAEARRGKDPAGGPALPAPATVRCGLPATGRRRREGQPGRHGEAGPGGQRLSGPRSLAGPHRERRCARWSRRPVLLTLETCRVSVARWPYPRSRSSQVGLELLRDRGAHLGG